MKSCIANVAACIASDAHTASHSCVHARSGRVLIHAVCCIEAGTENTQGPSTSKGAEPAANKAETVTGSSATQQRIEKPQEVISFEAAKEVGTLCLLMLSLCLLVLSLCLSILSFCLLVLLFCLSILSFCLLVLFACLVFAYWDYSC